MSATFIFALTPPSPTCTQTAEWILEDLEASFCYQVDAANSQQREILGQILSRRDTQTGVLDLRVLSMTPISDKTAEGQVKAYKAACVAIVEAAEQLRMRATDPPTSSAGAGCASRSATRTSSRP
jgi:hypothetical protein